MNKPPLTLRNEPIKSLGDHVSITDLTKHENIHKNPLIGEVVEHEENPSMSTVLWNDGRTTRHYDQDLYLVGD